MRQPQVQSHRVRREKDDGRVDGLEVEGDDAIVGRIGRSEERIGIARIVRALGLPDGVVLRAGPRMTVVGVERRAAKARASVASAAVRAGP